MEVNDFLSKIKVPLNSKKLIQQCISRSVNRPCEVSTAKSKSKGVLLQGSSSKEFFLQFGNEISSYKPADFLCIAFSFSKDDFKTDAEITKAKGSRRKLEAWSHEGPELSLESEDRNWDQFAINAQKFGVTSTYQEELYTTKKVSPNSLSKEQLKAAHEKERQILGSGVKEVEEEEDEEKLFSAVIGSGRYQEPELPKRERATSFASSVEGLSKDEYKKTREYLMNPQRAKKTNLAEIAALDALDLTIAQTNNEEVIMSFYKFKQEMQPSRQSVLKSFQEFSNKLREEKVSARKGLMVIDEEVSVMNMFVKKWKEYLGGELK